MIYLSNLVAYLSIPEIQASANRRRNIPRQCMQACVLSVLYFRESMSYDRCTRGTCDGSIRSVL